MYDRIAIHVLDTGHDSLLELLSRCHSDVAQHRSIELREEALYEVEPLTVLVCEHELEATLRSSVYPGYVSSGDEREIIVEDQLDLCASLISRIYLLEELDELSAAMAIYDHSMHQYAEQIYPANRLSIPWRLYSWSRAELACLPRFGG